jgi:hypothetical protein
MYRILSHASLSTSRSSVILLAAASILTACSTQESGTATGDSVLVSGAQHVIWQSAGGGFGPQVPAGAACHGEATYDLAVQDGSLAWSVCHVSSSSSDNDPSAYTLVTGSRTLSADERTQATTAARAVTVSSVTTCGADLDSRSLQVDATSGSIVYGDDFYACEKRFDHYVHSAQLQNLWTVLDAIVSPTTSP